MEQVIRFTDVDGIDKWTDVYSGPLGSGYIEYEATPTMMRSRHVGPEQREDTGWLWVEVKETPLV